MRRKIFICFFVVLLMTTLVVPAFATSADNADGPTYSAISHIDHAVFLTDSVKTYTDWPHNSAKFSDSEYPPFAYYSSIPYHFLCSIDDLNNFVTEVHVADCRYVYLHLDDLLLDLDNPDKSRIQLNFTSGGLKASRVQVSGYSCAVDVNNNTYELVRSRFSFYYDSAYVTDVLVKLREYLAYTVEHATSSYLYFQDVEILLTLDELTNEGIDDGDYFFTVTTPGTIDPVNFLDWFNDYHFSAVTVTSKFNLFDWLLDSVNAFMDFQLFPEFTVNRLFQVILIIGLLFWFLKLVI